MCFRLRDGKRYGGKEKCWSRICLIKTELSKLKWDSSHSEIWEIEMYSHALWPCKDGIWYVVVSKPLRLWRPLFIFPHNFIVLVFCSAHFAKWLPGWQQKDHLLCLKYLVLITINHATTISEPGKLQTVTQVLFATLLATYGLVFSELLISNWNLAVPVVINRVY